MLPYYWYILTSARNPDLCSSLYPWKLNFGVSTRSTIAPTSVNIVAVPMFLFYLSSSNFSHVLGSSCDAVDGRTTEFFQYSSLAFQLPLPARRPKKALLLAHLKQDPFRLDGLACSNERQPVCLIQVASPTVSRCYKCCSGRVLSTPNSIGFQDEMALYL